MTSLLRELILEPGVRHFQRNQSVTALPEAVASDRGDGRFPDVGMWKEKGVGVSKWRNPRLRGAVRQSGGVLK